MVKPGKRPKDQKPGPDPEELKVEGDWEEAVKKALKKKRPKDGWPEGEDPPGTS